VVWKSGDEEGVFGGGGGESFQNYQAKNKKKQKTKQKRIIPLLYHYLIGQ